MPTDGAVNSFFFNDTATTEIYTLSRHVALPICTATSKRAMGPARFAPWDPVLRNPLVPPLPGTGGPGDSAGTTKRSEEHTPELQSRQYLVCRLLLEKKHSPRGEMKVTYHRKHRT